MTDHDRDVFILAVTAVCEASNQGDDGLIGVTWSIINRFNEHQWDAGKTIAATCLKPWAYSSWNTEDPNRVRVLSMGVADPIFHRCLEIASAILEGTLPDPTDGATHYYSVKIDEPNWVSGLKNGVRVAPAATFTVQIKDHRFYKAVQ